MVGMIFWQHNNDLSKPPELEDLRRRRPDNDYWESRSSNKTESLVNLWERWKRETGKEFPRKLPTSKAVPRTGVINRMTGDRRVDHQKGKDRD